MSLGVYWWEYNLNSCWSQGCGSGQNGLGWEVTSWVGFWLKNCTWLSCERSVEELYERYTGSPVEFTCWLALMFLPTCVGCSFSTCDICLFLHWLEGLCFFTSLVVSLACELFRAVLKSFTIFLSKTNETLEKLLLRVWLHGTRR